MLNHSAIGNWKSEIQDSARGENRTPDQPRMLSGLLYLLRKWIARRRFFFAFRSRSVSRASFSVEYSRWATTWNSPIRFVVCVWPRRCWASRAPKSGVEPI